MFATLSRAAYVRIIPFLLFMALLALRGNLPADTGIDLRWLYGLSTLLVGGLLLWWRREYGELTRQNWPTAGELGLAIGVGLAVFGLWIVLDAPWMVLGEPSAHFVPIDAAGALVWPLVAVRLIGASLVVPVMEELFWRSCLMRWVQSPSSKRSPRAASASRRSCCRPSSSSSRTRCGWPPPSPVSPTRCCTARPASCGSR